MVPISIRKENMKKSYIQEQTLQIQVVIDLGEINTMISTLGDLDLADSGSWRARELVGKLKTLRREAAEEARREFERMIDQS